MIRISHIKTVAKPSSIVVRNYDSSIVHYPIIGKCDAKLQNEIGRWNIKYFNEVPIEYTKTVSYEPKT